jgi:hypothetical protein
MCDDAAAFVEWLESRHAHDLLPGGGDETGNLLDMQRSILAELRRMLHRVDAAHVGYETAGDVLFRVDQVSRYVDATAKTLQELNLRLLSFGIAEFSAEEAKPIVDELAVFLERFGRRFLVSDYVVVAAGGSRYPSAVHVGEAFVIRIRRRPARKAAASTDKSGNNRHSRTEKNFSVRLNCAYFLFLHDITPYLYSTDVEIVP